MRQRIASILEAEDLGTTGVKVINLLLKDICSRIELIWKTTVVTVSVMTAPHAACISKIELVDGSDVLASLSGEEVAALNYYNRKKIPEEYLSLTVGGEMISVFGIDFGRWLWDTTYAFDPKKFSNPQLRISWDEDAANAVVIVNSLEVNAFVFDEAEVSPVGFFMNKEIFDFVPTALASKPIDLPTDYPIRSILIRSKSTTISPVAAIGNIKISEENDKKVPVNISGDSLLRLVLSEYPRLSHKLTLDAAVTAKTIYAIPTYDVQANIEYDATAFVTAQSKFAVATHTNNKIVLSASVDIKGNDATVHGLCPHSCLYLPLGDQNNPEDWYDVTKLSKVQIIPKGASSVGTSPTMQIVLQQARKYTV